MNGQSTISQHIEQARSMLRQLPADMSIHTLQTALDDLAQTWDAVSHTGTPEQQAEQYPTLRFGLHKLTELVDDLQSAWAEKYRQEAGEEKDMLEQLTEEEQRSQNPIAYESKSTYHVIGQVRSILTDINAKLLDMRGEAEHQALRHQQPGESGRIPAYMRETDPAPPTLSP
ncbi:hypothetical protein DUZ99_14650 [Xylanibacillus composti]|uniref:Uncharacterized protein n=1 Tax=Xylanibacillus composti TaxID=1572762 RepID=A0A8J4GZG6_9BACL|nr:hypothetical protein [Xylanibacillus composti]MDT9726218.1 hypothetical protein [Xylanibacillus composti]GIQ68068.1 hypothetical protein XYCOK13_08920 [Xylanibacillus composti]